jgi:hypothetical protein
MNQDISKINLRRRTVIYGICFIFMCVSTVPAVCSISNQHFSESIPIDDLGRTSEGDVPTWYQGDEWIYTVNPLYYSGPNGSFSGMIENFKQKVVEITDGTYVVSITGDISGELTMNGFSGELTGGISGTSYVRVSDLAEITTQLSSQGTIIVLWIPVPYEMNIVTSSSPPLELYDFPINVGEQWQLACLNTLSGSINVEGVYEQSFNGDQWIGETVQCIQRQQLSVPAGNFECYEIGRTNNQGWYSTEVGNVVKSIIDQSNENMTLHIVITLQSFSHALQPIAVSEEITPTMVAPGASIVISGQAISTGSGSPIQNGVISIIIPSTGDSWSTTTNSNGYYSKTIVAPTMSDDTPSDGEIGSGGVIVECTSSDLFGYRVQTLTTVQDTPPTIPSIDGQNNGKVGVSYPYTVVAEDSEADDVFYFIDWGDETNSSWVGPYPSNENVILDHTFTKKGSYTITVKAKDIYYAESDWGTLQVSMPKTSSYTVVIKLLERFPFLFNLLHQLLRR